MDTVSQPQQHPEQGPSVKRELRVRAVGYIVAAFGLVAGLAWNDAIRSLIEYLFPLETGSLWAKFIYAVAITIVVVIVTVWIGRISHPRQKT